MTILTKAKHFIKSYHENSELSIYTCCVDIRVISTAPQRMVEVGDRGFRGGL